MKRLLTMALLGTALALSLSACGKKGAPELPVGAVDTSPPSRDSAAPEGPDSTDPIDMRPIIAAQDPATSTRAP
ncbi:MAG: hypothetical protein GC184_02385 [Rhizobiales bacterium]|nr:hypothetical protein [Hyphomicrobiales bacterium]